MAKSLIMIFFSIALAVTGQLFLKTGMNRVGPISFGGGRTPAAIGMSIVSNSQVMLGLSLYFLGAIVWLVVLSRVSLSFAYPLIGSSYVIVMLASRILFKESISPMRWGGAFLISLGVVLISRT